MGGGDGTARRSGRRIALAYVLLLVLVAVVAVVVLRAGADRRPAPAIGGVYRIDRSPPCLGEAGGRLVFDQSGQFVGLAGPGDVGGELALLTGAPRTASVVALEDAVVLAELLTDRQTLDQELWNAFTARRYQRASTVVEASNQLAQWQIDHVQGDIPGLMRSIAMLTSQPA
jgi:hypothetical protein